MKNNMMKKMAAWLMALLMMFNVCPISALAETTPEATEPTDTVEITGSQAGTEITPKEETSGSV